MNDSNIAIIGMSCRFPGANSIEMFWENLRSGVESISYFSDEELLAQDVDPALLSNPNYVKSSMIVSDIDLFDAAFFGFTPREAETTDPQHRLFLECAQEALEMAGYDPNVYQGAIGVYAGANTSHYLLHNLYPNHHLRESLGDYQLNLFNDRENLPTKTAYKLNLKGPALNVQTACSTSLVAIHLACQSLLNGECDMALAGGVSIFLPQKIGYLYQEGMILSPDGHCHAFDARAKGTVSGDGVGIVVLKTLEDALADGDTIHAIIKGSAINNDGSAKVGYTAPGEEGQTKAVHEAHAIAGVEPETITYVETHGTGTLLGDPIEIAALTRGFQTQARGFCAIGSVKTNIGHTGPVAGAAGLIKTVLALKHRQIPPSLHFEVPNPQIDFANSPFYVNTELSEWKRNSTPRRAGVSSFGIGGTNAHVILEEAPAIIPSGECRSWQLLLLSAKTPSALDVATSNLAKYLKQNPNINLADVAYTLQMGRQAFSHRRMVLVKDTEEATNALSSPDGQHLATNYQESKERPIVFMFPGQGAQYVNMAKDLYEGELTFREQVDTCAEILKPYLGLDLRKLLYPDPAQSSEATQRLEQTAITQPALFVIEYALAKLLLKWGVRPQAMVGHSIGEYVAACLAGVFSLKDALLLVATRGQLIQQLPNGAMLAVSLPPHKVELLLDEDLSLATINTPSRCVVSGTKAAVTALQKRLDEQGVECRLLKVSHAFHSGMMEPILAAFTEQVRKVNLQPPKIPYLSNVTGTWITAAEATDPVYWAKHLRQTVRFADGMQLLLQQSDQLLLEVGSGRTLASLARQHLAYNRQTILTSLRHPQEKQSDVAFLLETVGRLWLAGVTVNWSEFYTHERRLRVPLPTYPFERQRYWIIPPKQTISPVESAKLLKKPDIADWFYLPIWKQSISPLRFSSIDLPPQCWLLFVNPCGLGDQLAKRLEQAGQHVVTVRIGTHFTQLNKHDYVINPQHQYDYDALLNQLSVQAKIPQVICHFWSVTETEETENLTIDQIQQQGFYSLLYLAQALGHYPAHFSDPIQLTVVSNQLQKVTGEEQLCPEKATIIGPVKVIPQEYPNLSCRSVDVVVPQLASGRDQLLQQLQLEFTTKSDEQVLAYRGSYRWVQTFEPVRLEKSVEGKPRLRLRGVYLITGGLGGIGLVLAEYLAQTVQAKLILIGRKTFPERDKWEKWLATHDTQDEVSCKIMKLLTLEALGAEVIVKSADVANLEQMQAAIAQASKRFGEIHGVIHAAGIAGGGIIQLKTPETAASVLDPKVKGTRVLDVIFKNAKLDFFVLCSSLTSILSEIGQVDYCAANSFLDAFAHHSTSRDNITTSINWCTWQEVGMAVNTAVPLSLKELREESLSTGILPQEGTDAFSRILSNPLAQFAVSTQDLQAIIAENDNPAEITAPLEDSNQNHLSESKHPRPNLPNAYVAPRNETEQTIALIWQQSLGIEQIGIHDNFFNLGGDSLLITQVIFRIQQHLSVAIPARSLFENPTIASLAEYIKASITTHKQDIGNNEQAIANDLISQGELSQNGQSLLGRKTGEETWYPLSYTQQQFILPETAREKALVHDGRLFSIRSQVNIPALRRACQALINRHDGLRIRLALRNGVLMQQVRSEQDIPFEVIDASDWSLEQLTQQLEHIWRSPFDLRQEPPIRIHLFTRAHEDYILVLVIHHIVTDAWSNQLLQEELPILYQAEVTAVEASLPVLPWSFTDYLRWQTKMLSGAEGDRLWRYWQQQLSGILPILNLPTDRPRPPVMSHRGAGYEISLSRDVTQQLKNLVQMNEATLYVLIQAAFQLLLHGISGQQDILVGTVTNNRVRKELERIIGGLVDVAVLRSRLSGNPTFTQYLSQVRENVLNVLAHQGYPLKLLAERLQVQKDPSRPPIVQVTLNYIHATKVKERAGQNGTYSSPAAGFNELKLEQCEIHLPQFGNWGNWEDYFTLGIIEDKDSLCGMIKYNTDVFEETTIARIAESFQSLLLDILANPEQPILELLEGISPNWR